MESLVKAKYIRVSPKKLQPVARSIQGMELQEAIDRLFFVRTKSSSVLSKILHLVQADAVKNKKMRASGLRIKSIGISKGPFLKRYRAVSRGMAHQIKRRMSHIHVVVEEK